MIRIACSHASSREASLSWLIAITNVSISSIKAGQERAREFAGQKVKVTGTLKGRTINVSAIKAAS